MKHTTHPTKLTAGSSSTSGHIPQSWTKLTQPLSADSEHEALVSTPRAIVCAVFHPADGSVELCDAGVDIEFRPHFSAQSMLDAIQAAHISVSPHTVELLADWYTVLVREVLAADAYHLNTTPLFCDGQLYARELDTESNAAEIRDIVGDRQTAMALAQTVPQWREPVTDEPAEAASCSYGAEVRLS